MEWDDPRLGWSACGSGWDRGQNRIKWDGGLFGWNGMGSLALGLDSEIGTGFGFWDWVLTRMMLLSDLSSSVTTTCPERRRGGGGGGSLRRAGGGLVEGWWSDSPCIMEEFHRQLIWKNCTDNLKA